MRVRRQLSVLSLLFPFNQSTIQLLFLFLAFHPLPITHYLLLLLGSRLCSQLNEPLPREVILVVILLRGNELNKLNGLITHHPSPFVGLSYSTI